MESESVFKELEKTDLLEPQKRLLAKLRKKPFEMARKTTYEPLLELLKTVFICEYPDFHHARKLAQLFYDNDVSNIHSNYRYFQDVALWYLSYMSESQVKDKIYNKLIGQGSVILQEKRINRIVSEEHLTAALQKYAQAKEDLFYYYYGTAVISKAAQILAYPIENLEQKKRLHSLIQEIVTKTHKVLPALKSV